MNDSPVTSSSSQLMRYLDPLSPTIDFTLYSLSGSTFPCTCEPPIVYQADVSSAEKGNSFGKARHARHSVHIHPPHIWCMYLALSRRLTFCTLSRCCRGCETFSLRHYARSVRAASTVTEVKTAIISSTACYSIGYVYRAPQRKGSAYVV